MTEINANMYIALAETTEYRDGTKITRFIELDPTYINGKIDYYTQGRLDARKDLLVCE